MFKSCSTNNNNINKYSNKNINCNRDFESTSESASASVSSYLHFIASNSNFDCKQQFLSATKQQLQLYPQQPTNQLAQVPYKSTIATNNKLSLR